MARMMKSCDLQSTRALRIELPIWPLALNSAMFLSGMILVIEMIDEVVKVALRKYLLIAQSTGRHVTMTQPLSHGRVLADVGLQTYLAYRNKVLNIYEICS